MTQPPFRRPRPADHGAVAGVIDEWWGRPGLSTLVQALFFEHFASTSLVAEDDLGLRGFLLGFDSADHPTDFYIHFVGVRPDARRSGLGAALYERSFAEAEERGRTQARCITGLSNRGSIAFHRRLGFDLEPGDGVDGDGVPFHRDHGGPGVDQVLFRRPIAARLERRTPSVDGY